LDKQAEFLVKMRDCHLALANAADDLLNSREPPEIELENKKESAAVPETSFTTLKWETQRGARLGDFEIAFKVSNIREKWQAAHGILRNSNATIKERYQGAGYSYAYWIYNQDKIYRQKLNHLIGVS